MDDVEEMNGCEVQVNKPLVVFVDELPEKLMLSKESKHLSNKDFSNVILVVGYSELILTAEDKRKISMNANAVYGMYTFPDPYKHAVWGYVYRDSKWCVQNIFDVNALIATSVVLDMRSKPMSEIITEESLKAIEKLQKL